MVGALFSLTGGGSVYGPMQRDGAILAVQEVNDAGGILGRKLRLVLRDDHSDPVGGTIAMRGLIQNDHAVAVLGPSLSLVAIQADPVANSLKTPVLAVSNTIDGIVGRCPYACDWVWRNSLGESKAVPANIASYVGEKHPSVAAIVATDDVLGSDELVIAQRALASHRVRVALVQKVRQDAPVGPLVQRVVRAKPDAVFIGTTFGAWAAQVMEELRLAGYRGQFLGGNTFNSSATRRLAGASGYGARSGSAWWDGNDFPANEKFIRSFRQAYRVEPDQFAAQAYVGVQILADALGRASAGLEAQAADHLQAMRAAVQRSLGDVALITPLGPFRFTPDHDVDQIVWILKMNILDKHTLVGFCNPGC